MSQIPPVVDSFAATLCAQYGVPSSRYTQMVLGLTLYPHARWLTRIGVENLFAPDRCFVADVGLLRRWGDFWAEVHDFQQLPENRRFLRRRLRLRVSVRRMQLLFTEVMGASHSASPFAGHGQCANGGRDSILAD